MIENPFITYGYESAEYFCDRKAETRELITMLTNGNHTALISPRRMGKTGLIHHCFAQKEIQDRYYTFLIDIYATKNLQDMVYRIGQVIVNRLKSRGQSAIDGFLRFVTSLRTGISFDGQGNASWNVGVGDIKSPNFTLEEIFNYLKAADRKCIVAIDEFQVIADYPERNVEELMRTYVQECRNAVFVFSGSQKSMMSEMFSSPARPFYQSVSMMFLKPVALPAYESFAKGHFEHAGKQIADDVVKVIYERFDGTTWYLQKVLNQLFATKDSVVVGDIDKAVEQIINQNEEAYKDVLYQLTARQRDLLVAVSRERKAKHITGSAFIKRYHLTTASSVQKSAKILTEKQLLTHQQGIYEVYDKFMSEWLERS
ncbi:MAG: ATP-binding protein [Prevotella sp.]|nr:ATP-binding protein [Prevotella sp.]